MCPGRSAARSGALQTRDRYGLLRSRISDAPLRYRSRCIASGTRGLSFQAAAGALTRRRSPLPRAAVPPSDVSAERSTASAFRSA
jgi:hypothetical protein